MRDGEAMPSRSLLYVTDVVIGYQVYGGRKRNLFF